MTPAARSVSSVALAALLLASATALAAAPTASTTSATSVTATSAQLNGSINPGGESTTGWFRLDPTSPGTCNDTFGTRVPSTGGTGVGAGTSATPYTISATGLLPGTTYYFCAIAQNGSGQAFGSVLTFTTPALAPTVASAAATFVTATSATLNGSANPNGSVTTAFFRYSTSNPGSCSNSFGTRVPATGGTNLGGGNGAAAYTEVVTGLQPGVTYYFCALATNGIGTGLGNVLSFTTLVTAPTVTTTAASSITGASATLNGNANPNGAAATGWFRLASSNPGACSDAFGTRVPASGGTSLGSGTSAQAFAQSATGLSQGTTYWYCAIASNSEGTSLGALLQFTTPAAPTVTTTAETLLMPTSATLNGAATPNGSASYGYVRYSATSPGSCNDTFGTRVPSSSASDMSLGAGSSPVAFNWAVTGLLPGTTYFFCALARNAVGTSTGSLLSFTTPPALPIMTTAPATSVGGNTATLNGSGVPRGAATTGWFRYSTVSPGSCNDTFGTRVPASGGAALGAGNTSLAYSEALTGLTVGTVYYFCAIGQNSVGLAYGTVGNFTTHDAPVVTTGAASSVAGTTATLHGTGDPNLAVATGYFRYATTSPGTCNDTFGTRAPTTGGSNLGSGTSAMSFSQGLTGLTPGTQYFFCALATNAVGLGLGTVQTFTTPGAPTTTTNAASPVAATSATLNGAGVPNLAATYGYFRYSTTNPGACSDSFGTRLPSSSSSDTYLGAGIASTAFSQSATSLLPGTTYYFCALARNTEGTTFGAVLNFTTPPMAPAVTTVGATATGGTTATLNGTANPRGDATVGFFRYSATSPGSCNDTFGTRMPATGGTSLGSGNSNAAFTEALTGLSPGTVYYYCALASNGVGTSFGALANFRTPDAPIVTTTAATSVTGTSATLNGTGNPNGGAATGYFRYSTTNPGACNDAFGTRAPTSGGTSLGSGTTAQAFSTGLTGLTPGTTYFYCAIANNLVGTGFGSILSFDTPNLPALTTDAATLVTSTGATLNGTVTPNGASTTTYFRYSATSPGTCTTSFGTATSSVSRGAGTTPVTFSQAISGLLPGNTYYYCAIATNLVGTTLGGLLSFTTPPTAPVITTNSASGLSSSGATLNGTVNAGGAATQAWFRYDTVNPGTCNDSFGFRAPFTGGFAASGNTSAGYNQPLTGLSLATTYYFCAIAQNSVGTSFGTVTSFTTLAAPPAVTTVAASAITTTSATLNASAIPNGAAATGWFRYSTTNPGSCSDTFGTRAPSTGGTTLGNGTASVPFSITPGSLVVGQTYYFCAIASNSAGTSYGAVLTFKTLSTPPTLNTLAATGIGGTTATLNGSVNPNGDPTTGWFRYATVSPGTCNDTFGTRTPSSGGTDVGGGTSAQPYTAALTGLTPGATYYFCALAQNSLGTVVGLVLSFTTPQAPTVTTTAATPVTATTATLNASAIPNGTTSTGWFRYSATDPGSCNDTFGTRLPGTGGTSLGNGTSGVPYSQGLSGLSPGTSYYFCALASNGVGTSMGDLLSFTTPPAAPSVAAAPATAIGATTATFNASANPNGAATTGYFRYATTSPGTCNDAFGTRTPATGGSSLGAGTSVVAYTQGATGLTPGTTYYYCPIASNGVGTAFGGVLSFTTTAAPSVTTSAASAIASTTATLNGSGNPNRDQATGYFRYGTTNPGTCTDAFGTRAPASGGTDLGAGSSAVAFTQPLTGLTQGTQYWFCAAAVNSVGTTFGAVQTFTTTNAPSPTTLAASPVAGTTATLNGSTNPNGSATTAYFRWSATNPGTCTTTFGTATTSTSLGSGTAAVAHTANLTGLTSGTTYYYCAIGTNAAGTGFGAVVSFTTPGAPTLVTQAATAITTTGATLNGTGTANGATATGWFRYSATNPGSCTDTFGTRAPASGGSALGSAYVATDYSQTIAGLTQGTTYYFCAIGSNASGTRYGTVQSFTTQSAPVVTTSAASPVGSNTATLNGSANPRSSPTTGWFRYATASPGTCNDTFGTRAPASGGTDLGSGSTAAAYSQALTGLTPGTTYYVCALAQNANGLSVGAVQSFTTTAAPTVTTSAATAVLATSVTLNGSANPNRDATTGWFRYATTSPGTCDDTFGTRAPATGGTSLGSGSTAQAFSQALTGLSPTTTYYYCALASNGVGTTTGLVLSFTTPNAPAPTTTAASSVTSTTATLNGSTNPNGLTATAWFRYATTSPGTCNDTFGTRTPTSGGTNLGAGTAAVAHTAALTSLTSGTTYYFCAIASNAAGTAFGSVLSFTTPGAPVVTTDAATSVANTTATLNGSANPAGSATTAWFRYATSSPGTCNDTFGTRAPGSGGTTLGAGFVVTPFSQALTGLAQATTYYYCAIAQNSVGTRFGAVQSFTTAAGPSVATSPASGVTSTGATLNASANPRGLDATGWFRYSATNPGTCNDTFGTRAPSTGGDPLGSGSSTVGFAETLTGLTPGTTYYFCAIASNSAGTTFSSVDVFTTPGPPSITTTSVTAVTSTGATLNGTGVANLAAATGWFRYATTSPGTCNDTFGTRAPATGGANLGSGTSAINFSQALTGLTAGTTYYFCALGSNASGTSVGAVLSFTTPTAPVVTTQAATAVTGTGATLNGSANPNASPATGWFRYATSSPGTCNDTFGTRAPASGGTSLGNGTTAQAYSQALTGLSPGTTYYFCALASNSVGTAVGAVQSFTTGAATPTVTTLAATAISGTGATLNGSANPRGAATTGHFRWATVTPGTCNDTFGTRVPATGGTALGSGTTATSYSEALTGLTAGTTYYYCAIATNSAGTDFGLVASFTTASGPTVTTAAATAVTGTGATLNGTVNPRGVTASAYFRYATTAPGTCDDTFGTRAPGTGGSTIAAGTTAVSYSQNIFGLTPGTTYYYCAIATNVAGTGFGSVQTLRTPGAPTVMTSSAMVSGFQATLSGAGNPNGGATTGYFRFGTTMPSSCSDAFGTRAPASGGSALGSGTAQVTFSQVVTGLTAGSTYYFCAAASNSVGAAFGQVQSFTVTAPVPVVTTLAPMNVSASEATLAALVNPSGSAARAWFRYGTAPQASCDDTFGTRVPAVDGLALAAGTTAVPVSLAAMGLKPGQTYFVCALASNAGGAATGQVLTFTTPTVAPTVRTGAALVDDSGTTVQLGGFADTNGMSGSGWFQVSPTPPIVCNEATGAKLPAEGIPLTDSDDEVPLTHTIVELAPGTYYYCAAASTAGGTVFGQVQSFTLEGSTAPGCTCAGGGGELALVALAGWLVARRRRQARQG